MYLYHRRNKGRARPAPRRPWLSKSEYHYSMRIVVTLWRRLLVPVLILVVTTAVGCMKRVVTVDEADQIATDQVAKGSDKQKAADEVLRWFPESTETLIVNQGPFTILAEDPKPMKDLPQMFQYNGLGPLYHLQSGEFRRHLAAQTVLFSVEASRHFRAPLSLGQMTYEGCHALVFDPPFVEPRKELEEWLKKHAKANEVIEPHQVFSFEEKLESDIWKIYVTFVKDNELLCFTSEDFLRETLKRIDSGAQRQALPESLLEWKYVDRQARTWAVRHYRKEGAEDDPSSPLSGERASYSQPDGEAIGFVMNVDREHLSLRYLSSNPEAATIARDYWGEGVRVKMIATNVFDISLERAGSTPWILTLFGAFGHGLYI